MQSSEDNVYAKSLLHLGRLEFKQGNLDNSFKHLKSFFKRAQNTENKELLNIGRVNLGMIKGTQGMKEYQAKTKSSSFEDFLNYKLKFFPDGIEI